MRVINKNNGPIIKLNLLIFIVFSIINLTPYFLRNIPLVVSSILLVLWIFTAFLFSTSYFTKLNKLMFFVLMWILYLIITQIIGFADDAIGNLFHYLVFWFSIIIYDFYDSVLSIKQINKLKNLVIITMIVNILLNIKELIDNPYLSKYITGGVVSSEVRLNSNVGNYSYVLLVNIMMVVFINKFLTTKNKLHKLIFVIFSICSFYMVILASSMIGIITNVIMVITYLYYTLANNRQRKILFICTVLILGLSLYFIKDNIYIYLINNVFNIQNTLIRERLISVVDIIFGNYGQASFSGRDVLYEYSLKTFFNNFLIGVGRRHTNVNGVISLHSQILDDIAYFGVVGIICQFAVLYNFYRIHLYRFTLTNKKQMKPLIFSVITGATFYALFNPMINMNSGLMMFVFFPFICESIKNQEAIYKRDERQNV